MAEVPRESRASSILSGAANAEEEKPVRCAKFRQQELWAWKPVWSPIVVVIMYSIVAAIFIPLGIVIFAQSNKMLSTDRLRYDNNAECNVGAANPEGEKRTCTIPIEIDRATSGDSYFYYGMVNFYQNARTYVKSRSHDQLRGEDVTLSGVKEDCDPLEEDPDNPGEVLFPCGLIAQSRFNDSFLLCKDRECDKPVQLQQEGIAWDVDRETRFKVNPNGPKIENNPVEDEDFMVWMRAAAYRNWKKLYRIVKEPLNETTYYVRITASYPVESFNGQKFFFISETTWFGGPNRILGLAYLVVGCITLLLAILFLIRSRASPDLDLPAETTVLLDGISPDPRLTEAAVVGDDGRQGVSRA